MPIMPALRQLRQQIICLRPAWLTLWDLVSQTRKEACYGSSVSRGRAAELNSPSSVPGIHDGGRMKRVTPASCFLTSLWKGCVCTNLLTNVFTPDWLTGLIGGIYAPQHTCREVRGQMAFEIVEAEFCFSCYCWLTNCSAILRPPPICAGIADPHQCMELSLVSRDGNWMWGLGGKHFYLLIYLVGL